MHKTETGGPTKVAYLTNTDEQTYMKTDTIAVRITPHTKPHIAKTCGSAIRPV